MQKHCTYCERTFRSQRSNRKYCSDNCRQMAYYKRNGLMQSHGQSGGLLDTHQYLQGENTVKYNKQAAVKDVKQFTDAQINDTLLQTLADRILALIEDRIDRKLETVKYNTDSVKPVNVKHIATHAGGNVKDAVTVNHGFTVNAMAGDSNGMCSPNSFYGLQFSRTVKDNNSDTVKYENALSVKDVDDFTNNDYNDEEIYQSDNVVDEDTIDESEQEEEYSENLQQRNRILHKAPVPDTLQNDFTDIDDNQDELLQSRDTIDENTMNEFEQEEEYEEDLLPRNRILRNGSVSETLRNDFTVRMSKESPQEIERSIDTDSDFTVRDLRQRTVKRKDDYEWVESVFTERIEHFYKTGTFIVKEYLKECTGVRKQKCITALTYSKCLIRNLIRLSNSYRVDRETFVVFVNTLTKLVRSDLFHSLPHCLIPYTSTIRGLQRKLRKMAMAGRRQRFYKIRLSQSVKAKLMSIRFDLASCIEDIKFDHISLPD